MRPVRFTAAIAAIVLSSVLQAWAQAPARPALDRFGGLMEVSFDATGFFRTQFDGTRWWLVTPEGHGFFSIGVNHISPDSYPARGTSERPYQDSILKQYGSEQAWSDTTFERLREWGVNTVGAWSCGLLDTRMPYTRILDLTGYWKDNSAPDFFSPAFEEDMKNGAAQAAASKDDPWLIGYFLGNELPWATDHRRGPSLFDTYCAFPADAPGKQRLVAFFQARYESLEAFGRVWKDAPASWDGLAARSSLNALDETRAVTDREAFTLEASRKYFETATRALRAADPNHLALGVRFIWQRAPRAVIQACGESCDVVSINFYETGWLGWLVIHGIADGVPILTENINNFAAWYDVTKKPLMITEFSFRGGDALPPNTFPPGCIVQPVVPTQKDRARKFDQYVTMWSSQPWFVGYHWFEHADEPIEGRFDGENGNYGLVDIHDAPHEGFVKGFEATNWRILNGLAETAK